VEDRILFETVMRSWPEGTVGQGSPFLESYFPLRGLSFILSPTAVMSFSYEIPFTIYSSICQGFQLHKRKVIVGSLEIEEEI